MAAQKLALEAAITAVDEWVEIGAAGAGVSHTTARRCVVLPTQWAVQAASLTSSYLSFTEFYDLFLLPVIADASYDHILHWWKCSTTCGTANTAGDRPKPIGIVGMISGTPAEEQVLHAWVSRHSITDLSGLGGGAAGLNSNRVNYRCY